MPRREFWHAFCVKARENDHCLKKIYGCWTENMTFCQPQQRVCKILTNRVCSLCFVASSSLMMGIKWTTELIASGNRVPYTTRLICPAP